MREEICLDALSAALMSPEEFASHTIVVPFEKSGHAASMQRIEMDDDACEALKAEVRRVAHRFSASVSEAGRSTIAEHVVQSLLTMPVQRDVTFNRLPSGRCVAMVRKDILSSHGVSSVVREIHRREVSEAHAQGQPVAADNLGRYGLGAGSSVAQGRSYAS